MADISRTLMKLADYEVALLVEGNEVEHYQVEIDEERKTASCWIASEVGKHFGIRLRKAHTLFDCATDVILDGHSCGGKYLRDTNVSHAVKDSINISESQAQLFTFSALTVTDDESSVQDIEAVKSLGEMKIRFKRATEEPQNIVFSEPPKPLSIHERAKKAAPHRVEYGKKVAFNGTMVQCKYHEIRAEFVIRYTSLDMLQAMGIAPRPEPTPPPVDLPQPEQSSSTPERRGKRKADEVKTEDQDSDEELDPEERHREAELQAELERLRQTRESRRAQKRVKTEVFAPVFTPGEVIDLT